MNSRRLLQVKGVSYSYGIKQALFGVGFDLLPGEIHALVGDHRAGKSTLIRIICGALRCRKGEIILPEGKFAGLSPRKARQLGIGAVFQEEMLVPSLSTIDNVFSGRFAVYPGGIIRWRRHIDEFTRFCRKLDLDFDFTKPVGQLDKVNQHLVEFLRAIYFDPSILILDEISTRFTPREMDFIYRIILDMKKKGKGIIYISHDMDEVMEFADRVTILRNGRCRKTENIRNLDKMQLYYMTYSHELSRKELRQANYELYNFKRYNEAIIRNIPVGVVILDKDNGIYQVNQAAENLLSPFSADELTLEKIFSRIDKSSVHKILLAIRSKKRMHLENLPFGDEHIIDFFCSPFTGDAGELSGTILLINNKTEEHNAKEYMRRTEQISSIAELAAGVAHEINNPLNIILNYMDLITLETQKESSIIRLKKIEKEIQRISEITGSLLSFSKVNNVELVECDLRQALKEAVLLLKYRIEKKKVVFSMEIPDEPVVITGNLNKLEQVFINLLINSLDALEAGGKIRACIRYENNNVYAAVSDNGPGIEHSIVSKIFDPFFTTKIEDKNSGLGLTVSMHIIMEHNGLLECHSEGGWTTFGIRLAACSSKTYRKEIID